MVKSQVLACELDQAKRKCCFYSDWLILTTFLLANSRQHNPTISQSEYSWSYDHLELEVRRKGHAVPK